MAHSKTDWNWEKLVALSTAIIATLAAITSFQASSNSSLMLDEKNNSILFQSKANKEWNNYLAADITRRILQKSAPITQEQKAFQEKAAVFENQALQATSKFEIHFQKNSHFVTAGTFLEIAIALSAMSTLVKQRIFWFFSLCIAGIGVYFSLLAFI